MAVKKILSSIALMLCFNAGFSQNESLLVYFSAEQINNSVRLNFTIQAGNLCNGITVLRSADGINFTVIGDIQGVCGSTDRNESYSYTDASPEENTYNYYRLELGGFGLTHTTGLLFIRLIPGKAFLFPNPFTSSGKMLFENTAHEELELIVSTREGKSVYQATTKNDHFLLTNEVLLPGLYFFNIFSSGVSKYQGKFAVH